MLPSKTRLAVCGRAHEVERSYTIVELVLECKLVMHETSADVETQLRKPVTDQLDGIPVYTDMYITTFAHAYICRHMYAQQPALVH